MSFIFGSSAPAPAPTLTAPVTDNTEAVKEAARREAELLRRRRGFQSTILTGPGGAQGAVPGTKAILG